MTKISVHGYREKIGYQRIIEQVLWRRAALNQVEYTFPFDARECNLNRYPSPKTTQHNPPAGLFCVTSQIPNLIREPWFQVV
jgi:hypothetical protein